MCDPEDKPQDSIPGIDAWLPWHPDEAKERLLGAAAIWCVAGGWALDLWLGRKTRPHSDLEIAALRADFAGLRERLRGFKLFVAADGELSELPPDSRLDPGQHHIWLLDEPARFWRLSIMLEPGDVQTWVYRRDESLRCPRSQMMAATAEGVPYLNPQGVLIYKAKATRPKDEMDFNACVGVMGPAARAWLKNALIRLHPSHHWIERLN